MMNELGTSKQYDNCNIFKVSFCPKIPIYRQNLHLRHHPCFAPLPKKLHEHTCTLSMRPLTSARRMLDDFVKNREQTLLRIAAIEEISASKKLKT